MVGRFWFVFGLTFSILLGFSVAHSASLVPTTPAKTDNLIVNVAQDFPDRVEVKKNAIFGKRWSKLQPEYGRGSIVCWSTNDNYLCFGLRCGKGRGVEFVHLYSHGDFQSGRDLPIYVDGERITTLAVNTVETPSEFVTPFDPDKHSDLLDALKGGSTVSIGYNKVFTFTLKGSSRELKRVARQCKIPARKPSTVAKGNGGKLVVANGSVHLLFNTDLSGGDYRSAFKEPSLQGISEDDCQNLCIQDRRCTAYTFNTKRDFCFLKNGSYTKIGHRDARSGIITDRKLVAAPSAQSRFKKNAIKSSIARIIRDYQPTQSTYDYLPAKLAAVSFGERLSVRSKKVDLGKVLILPWTRKRYYDQYDMETALLGSVTPEPSKHLVISQEHGDVLRYMARNVDKYGQLKHEAAKEAHRVLGELARKARFEYGENHPKRGLVMLDVAYVKNYLRHPDEITQAAISKRLETIRKVYREAESLIEPARSSDPEINTLLNQHVVWGSLQGISNCAVEEVPFIESAIAHHRIYNGDNVVQLGWISKILNCEKDVPTQIQMSQIAVGIAGELDSSGRPVAEMLIKLGRAQFLAGNKAEARAAFREAFRIHHQVLAKTKPDMEFVSFGESFENATWTMLMDLGLDAELDLYLARTIELQIANEYTSNNAGLSWVDAFSDVLEGSRRIDLANQYYTFLGGVETIPSPVRYMTGVADRRMDRGEFGVALHILNRALPIAKDLGKNEEFITLAGLTRAYHERGDFDNALKSGRQAIRIVKSGLKIGETEKWALKSVQTILANAEAEQGNRDAYALALAEQVRNELNEACKPGGNLGVFPSIPTAALLEDPVLRQAFMESDVVAELLSCFNQNRKKLDGIYAGKWKQNGPTPLQPHNIANIVLLLALADDRERFDELFEFISKEAKWTFKQSDTLVLSTIWSKRFNSESKDKLLIQARAFAGMGMFGAYAAIVRGLSEGNKGEWLTPHLKVFMEQAGPKAAEKLIHLHRHVASSLPLIALDLHSIGQEDLAQEYYATLKPWLRRYRISQGNECDSVEECEFLTYFEELYGKIADALQSEPIIVRKFISLNSGASLDSSERERITSELLLEGKRHERAGRYRIAKAYFQTFSEDTIKDILAVKDPLLSIDTIRSAASMARVTHKLGKDADVRSLTSHFISAMRTKLANKTMLGSDSVIRWSYRLRDIFETHLDAAASDVSGEISGDENFFLALQYLQATRTADTVAKLSAREPAGKLVKKQQEIADGLAKLHSKLSRSNGKKAGKLLKQIADLEAQNAKLVERLQKEAPDYLAQTGFRFPSLKETRAQLQKDEVLLLAFTGREHTYLWMISSNGDRFIRAAASPAQVEKMVQNLRKGVTQYLETPQDQLNGAKWNLEPFYAPYRELLTSFEPQLKDAQRIVFVPNGAFDALPLGALLTASPGSADMDAHEMRAKKLPWMIRKHAINVLPSVSSMTALSSSRAQANNNKKKFLGIGNPDFSLDLQVAALPTRSVSTQTVSISPLPDTEDEVTKIAEILGGSGESDLLLQSNANESAIKSADLTQYSIVNFATHGVLADQIPGVSEPALILSVPKEPSRQNDGLLTASEISGLDLDADLVMLSACNTAGSDGRPGAEGLSGLARSFFYAGARGLVVTHWEIPSTPAVKLAIGMISAGRSQSDRDWSKALRTSVLKLMDQTGDVSNAHPAAWGAHMVVGMR